MGGHFDTMCDHALRTAALLAGKPSTDTVTYNRTGETAITLTSPVQAATEFEAVQDDGGVSTWQSVDWLFQASDLSDLTPATPQRGDYVEHTDAAGTVRRYPLMAPPGFDHWRYMDRGRAWIRVHTKLTSEV